MDRTHVYVLISKHPDLRVCTPDNIPKSELAKKHEPIGDAIKVAFENDVTDVIINRTLKELMKALEKLIRKTINTES